ncbi:MAG: Crp/Fnr family transcriptional regulator [Eubacteriales bacterium]|nr:Crp/Fnr family transcriptional regulator [Eubacteriales bacterium]
MTGNIDVISFFRENYRIYDEKLLKEMDRIAQVRQTTRGEILLKQGEVPRYILFHLEGIERGYYIDDSGVEHTEGFSGMHSLPLMPATALDEPSSISVEVLKAGEILLLPTEKVLEMLPFYPALLQAYNRILQYSVKVHVEIKNALLQYDAKQRYLWFIKKFPGITEQVNHRYIASFLDMTPETLSRIRKMGGTAQMY